MPRPIPALCAVLTSLTLWSSGCTVVYHRVDDTSELPEAHVRPGIEVLLTDSVALIRGRRIGLLTNQTGVDRAGHGDVELLREDDHATKAKVKLVALFAPEHGAMGREDRTNLSSTVDRATGLPVYSLYGRETVPPPDSVLRQLDAVVIDLQDVGVRTWTYEGAMVYTMRAAARANRPVIVLDRPNPITGAILEGPVLDSALANPDDPTPGRPGLAYALAPIPLRHGMTMAELARYYNVALGIKCDLHVVPMQGWRRELWFDRTNLPFITPSPNLPSFHSVILYPALVPFEATNLSVGRGTGDPFQLVGAPWLDAGKVIRALKDQGIRGVQFSATDVVPSKASDDKYNGRAVHAVRITVVDRSELQTTRLFANLLVAINKVHPGQLRIDTVRFDRLFGSSEGRRALLRGEDPDAVVDRQFGPVYAFRERVKPYLLY